MSQANSVIDQSTTNDLLPAYYRLRDEAGMTMDEELPGEDLSDFHWQLPGSYTPDNLTL